MYDHSLSDIAYIDLISLTDATYKTGRPLIPKICIVSGKTLWWKPALKITRTVYPMDSRFRKIKQVWWADEQEFMWWKLKQEDIHVQ